MSDAAVCFQHLIRPPAAHFDQMIELRFECAHALGEALEFVDEGLAFGVRQIDVDAVPIGPTVAAFEVRRGEKMFRHFSGLRERPSHIPRYIKIGAVRAGFLEHFSFARSRWEYT